MSDGLGGSRLKKLFRTSKAGAIDPLPVPDALASAAPPQQPQPKQNDHRKHRHDKHGSVTPFPMDIGRQQGQSQVQQVQQQQQQQQHPQHPQPPPLHVAAAPQQPAPPIQSHAAAPAGAHRAPHTTRTHDRERSTASAAVAPTLSELQMMEGEAASAHFRSDAYAPPSRSRRGTGSTAQSVDTWPNSQTSRQLSTGPSEQPIYLSQGSEPVFGASFASGQQQQPQQPQQQSPTSQPGYFLPPGAGPPSPQFRPATPPVGPAPRHGHHPHSSIGNLSALPPSIASGAYVPDDGYASGRSRGYSSASQSNRGSDHEGTAQGSTMLAKPAAPMGSQQRSPLAQSYSTDLSNKGLPGIPNQPHPPVVPPAPQRRDGREDDFVPGKQHEKKRFWGWGDRKHKEDKAFRDTRVPQQRDTAGMYAMPRPSGDEHPYTYEPYGDADVSNNGHGSSIGHGLDDASRHHPRNFIERRQAEYQESSDIGAAVRMLCATRDTTFAGVLDLCERVNASDQGEAVSKEVARSLRKVFKHGSDPERRMASRVWYITLANIKVPTYKQHATSKKLRETVEPLCLQQTKPPISPQTYKTLMIFLSGMIYSFHTDPKCDGLLDLWRKIKRPEDPEFGSPLPEHVLPITPDLGKETKEQRRERKERERRTRELDERSRDQMDPLAQPRPVLERMPLPSPPASLLSRPHTEPLSAQNLARVQAMNSGGKSPSSPIAGVPYTHLPDHHDDMNRLVADCGEAKECALMLNELLKIMPAAAVSADEEIQELHRRCLRAQESLSSQIDWAHSEAAKSRRVADSTPLKEQGASLATREESALDLLLDAYGLVSDTLALYSEKETTAAEEEQYLAVQERSKTDTRMDRRQQMDMLTAGDGNVMGSSSRSPSPARPIQLPVETVKMPSPKPLDAPQMDKLGHAFAASSIAEPVMARTARSNSLGGLRAPPKLSEQPRTGSPQGRSRMTGPRPLPNPFKTVPSNASLSAAADGSSAPLQPPRRNGSDSSSKDSRVSGVDGDEEDTDTAPTKPSRKALGKRRAQPVDPDNDFDPNELFNVKTPAAPPSDSDHSITADDVYLAKPVVYAYDAWAEAVAREKQDKMASAIAVAAPIVSAPTPPPRSAAASTPGPGARAPTVSAR